MAEQVEHVKWVPNTRFMVDGFKFQSPRCKHYWLSHYHSDHTIGLTTTFSAGTIFCSQVTANLLVKDMRINPCCIQPLPLNTPLLVDGIHVTLIDANHCPGAVLFLFKTSPPPGSEFKEQVILHTGDMRWHPRMGRHPALANQRIDLLFLDTTYASPKHVFPCQEDAIADIVKVMRREDTVHPNTLFVVGSYRIGKERAYLGAAKALGWKVHVNTDKLRVLRLLGLPEADMALLTRDAAAARIHVSFMGKLLTPDALAERMRDGGWSRVVAFRPTGWSFQKSGLSCRREGDVAIYGVPYSEHSSFAELRDCVKTLRPRRIIPTVNASTPAAARTLVDRFADLMDLSRDRSRLDFFLRKAKTAPSTLAAPAPIAIPDCPIKPCSLEENSLHSAPAASQQAACGAESAHSAPAELAADPAPGGACSELEADRGCHEDLQECGSEACSERGEDAEEDGDTAIDLVSPEKGAFVDAEWRGHRSVDREWRDGVDGVIDRGDEASGGGAQRAQRAAELVHLGLDSPPDSCRAAEAPFPDAAAHCRGGCGDENDMKPGASENAAEVDAAAVCEQGVAAGGGRYQCVWPRQSGVPGKADSAAESDSDSWSSDSWDEVPERAAKQESPGNAQRNNQEDCSRGQASECLEDGRSRMMLGVSLEELQNANTGAASNVESKADPASLAAMAVKPEDRMDKRADVRAETEEKSEGERDGPQPEEAAVDLSAVDVAEQERILRMIELHRRARPRGGGVERGPARKRGQATVAGGNAFALMLGSQTKRRQLSIGAFVLKAPSTKQ